PEGDVTVSASIGGTTLADGVQLTAGYLENFSGLIDTDQVEFITAGRPNLDEISSTGVEVDFQNISEIGNSVDASEFYVISPNRDALIVVNSSDFSVKQVLEEVRDDQLGVALTDLREIHANPDGRFVYVLGNDGDLGIFSRDVETGLLTFQQIQSFDSPSNFTVKSQQLVSFEFVQAFDSEEGVGFLRDFGIAVVNETGGWRGDEWLIRSFQRDAETGTFSLLDPSVLQSDLRAELARPGEVKSAEFFAGTRLVVVDDDNNVSVIDALPGSNQFLAVTHGFANSEFQFGEISRVESSDVPGEPRFHVISTEDDTVTTFTAGFFGDGSTFDIEFTDQIVNGADGVIGLDGPTDIAVSSGGDFIYITSRDGSVAVFERNGFREPAQFVQTVNDDVAGFSGLDNPVSVIPSSESAIVATAGDARRDASLVALDAVPIVGGTLRQNSLSDDTNVVVVLPEAFPTEPGRLSSFSYYLTDDAVSDAPPEVTPLLLERSGDDWLIVGVGKSFRFSSTDLISESFELVEGSAQTSDRYFGFRLEFADPTFTTGVTYQDSPLEQAIVFTDPGSVSANQLLTGGATVNRDYSIQAATLQRVHTGAVVVDFDGVESLTVQTGDGSGVLTLRDAQNTNVTSTSILAGGGDDRVNV
ncbi:MAG: lactonase family protein, partial [Pirellulales bacterium]|nr:lactonase family protein [Pirellulales bacterium]